MAVVPNRYNLLGRRTGTANDFRRLGMHVKTGKLYWYGTAWAKILQARGLLKGRFVATEWKVLVPQARRQGFDIKPRAVKPNKRELLRRTMAWSLDHEPRIHYRQARPFRSLAAFKNRSLPCSLDCSEGVTAIAYAAGCPDPNGFGYNGYGNTSTLRHHCPRISISTARVGDFIVYGSGYGRHVVMIYADAGTPNPLVWSHGQESGPRLYRHSVQVGAHGSYYTVHRMPGAD